MRAEPRVNDIDEHILMYICTYVKRIGNKLYICISKLCTFTVLHTYIHTVSIAQYIVHTVPDSPPMTGLLSKCSSSSETVWNFPNPKLNSLPSHLTGKCFTEFLALKREGGEGEGGEGRGRGEREGGRERERGRGEGGREGGREREGGRGREREGERGREGGERGREREGEGGREREREGEGEREREREGGEREREGEGGRERGREGEGDGEREEREREED